MTEPVNQRGTKPIVAATLLTLLCVTRAFAVSNTYTVTNTLDSGPGSLRQAMLDANANVGLDTIAFDIPASDGGCSGTPNICTIKPATTLPQITSPVVIDGYTQPVSQPQARASKNTQAIGDDAVLLVEIDATNLNPVFYFPGAASIGSRISGLVISHLVDGGAIESQFQNGTSNLTVSGNFIGTDPTGTVNSGNRTAMTVESSTGWIIGGTAPADRNLIAAGGLFIDSSSNTTVQGNYFGLDKTGTTQFDLAPINAITVSFSSGSVIGGSASGAGNVIGLWAGNAILFGGPGNDNSAQGNFIGTNAAGTVRFSVGQVGINYGGSGTGNKIGGAAEGEGNLVAGASIEGILLQGTSTDIVVEGNLVGMNSSGTPLGNSNGIAVQSGHGTIGGTAARAGNRIAANASLGITINSALPGWSILGNNIYANGSLGISLSGGGTPTQNDIDDADTGANDLQNFPLIGALTIGPATMVHVSGSLNSIANTTFRIEFFANANCDHSQNGQGKIFLGSVERTTSGNNVSFGPLDFAVPADRHVITATATELVGAGLAPGNTSEFSACSTQDSIFSDGYEND